MSETAVAGESYTVDDLNISASGETAEQIKANLESEGKPAVDPEVEASKAAATLGARGGKAAAEAREKAKAESIDEDAEKGDDKPEPVKAAKPKEEKAEDAEDDADKGKSEAERRRHDPQARIAQLAREKNEALRAVTEMQERVAKLEEIARRVVPQEPERKASPAADDMPKPEDYETYDAYVAALAEKIADAKLAKARTEEQQTAARREAERQEEERNQGFVQRREAAIKRNPEIVKAIDTEEGGLVDQLDGAHRQAVQSGKATPQSVLADEVWLSDYPMEILAYFTAQPEECKRVIQEGFRGGPRVIARAIREIELKVAPKADEKPPEPKPAEREVSKAKPPVRTVQPSAHVGGEPGDDASLDDHIAYWNSQDRRR